MFEFKLISCFYFKLFTETKKTIAIVELLAMAVLPTVPPCPPFQGLLLGELIS